MAKSPLGRSPSEDSKGKDQTSPEFEHIAPPASEEKIVQDSPPLSETRTPEPLQRDAKTIDAKPKRMDSLNLPEPIPPAEYSDLPEPVVSLSQLPEAVQRTGSRACAKDTELRKLSQSDAVATTGTDGSGPSEAQNITVQPSDTEGYQRLASPMKPDQTDGVAIVTPLRLLGDQSDFVDCPFCRRQVETRVEKSASKMTFAIGTALCLTTFIAMWVPCYLKWYSNVDHYCGNCDRVLAHREYNKKEVEVYGTPEHLKEVSKYPAAPPRPVEEKAKQDSQHHQL